MDLREVFAGNLRRLRHAKGMSQDDLAYEAEISRSYLSQLEKGAFYASLKIVGKVAQALDVQPAELLKITDSPSRAARFQDAILIAEPGVLKPAGYRANSGFDRRHGAGEIFSDPTRKRRVILKLTGSQ